MATATLYDEIAANKRKTWFLLFVFVVLIGGLVAAAVYFFFGDLYISAFVIPAAALYIAFSYYSGMRMATASAGAHEVDLKTEPRLYRIVENLAITEGMPMPKVYVMEDPALNAFATGRNPENAIVAATRGLLNTLDDSELEGVMAHELGHVKNYDIRVSLMAFAMVAFISLMTDIFLNSLFFDSRDDDNNGGTALMIVILVVASIAASLLRFSISREREYLADASGALTTRYPEGLASALEKLGKSNTKTRKQSSATAHLFIANPLKGSTLAGLFSTHPPIEKRVARLRDMEDGVLGNGM